MPVKGSDRGQRFEFRPGVGNFTEWKGMVRDGDPGSTPVTNPRLLINGYIRPGEIVARPGQSLFTEEALQDDVARVRLLSDFQLSSPHRQYTATFGCPGIGVGGYGIIHLSFDQSPKIQRSVYYDTAVEEIVMGIFDARLYVGVDSALKRGIVLRAQHGIDNLTVSGSQQDVPIVVFPGSIITALQSFDSKLFIARDAGVGTSIISAYDGVSVLDDLTGIGQPTGFGIWQDKLILGFDDAANHIRIREPGDIPGTWTTVAPGVGTTQMHKRGLSYKNIFYWTDGDDDIWQYDGTSVTLVHTVTGALFMSLGVGFDRLYYAYRNSSNEAVLGMFDGLTWDDTHKEFVDQFPTHERSSVPNVYGSDLYVVNLTSFPNHEMLRSDRDDTAGDWEIVDRGALTGVNQPIMSLTY